MEPFTKVEYGAGMNAKSAEELKTLSTNSQISASLFKTYKRYKIKGFTGSQDDNNITLFKFKQFINCGQYRVKSKNIFDCNDTPEPAASGQGASGQGASGQGASGQGASGQPGATGQGATATGPGATATGPGATATGPGATATGPGATPIPGAAIPPPKPPRTGPSAPLGSPSNPIPATATPLDGNIEVDISKQVFEDENFKRVDLSIFIPKADSKVIVRNYANDTARQTIENMATFGV